MTNSPGHRRRTSRTARTVTGGTAAVLVAVGAFALAGHASADEEPAPAAAPRAQGTPFAPYVDTSLQPAYDLPGSAAKTGVKDYHLAFVTGADGNCAPKWGGGQDLKADQVARQIPKLRAKGGDVRISFGGANGSELGVACGSVKELTAAYGKVVDAFALKKIDLDIEGAALPDTAANDRRAKAVAALQKKHPKLDVSVTLPVLPEGLTAEGVALLENAKENGAKFSAVNLMAMDYGPSYDGDMGGYAVRAATAAHGQLKKALGLGDAEAWRSLALTPMIGVNDVPVEVFTPADARQVKKFADKKGLAWVSMWSGTRDKPCPGGPKKEADPTCSSVDQRPHEFTEAFTG